MSDEIGQPYQVMPAKRSWDDLDFGINWTRWLARFWEPGTVYAQGTRVRPTVETGFEYECITAGQSGARDPSMHHTRPRWPTVVGEELQDGSARWACRALSNGSLLTTISLSEWEADDGVTLSNQQTQGLITTVWVAGGLSGSSYSVRNRITLANGQKKEGELIIPVAD